MKITYNWLKEYCDIKISPEQLAHILTMAGSEVKTIDAAGGDHVFEIEITPNRADCLSVIGIAREVAAITGKKLKVKSSVISRQSPSGRLRSAPLSSVKGEKVAIEIKDKKLCPRYSGRVITGAKVADAPAWMRERLKAFDSRPVNNIVDITNFCLFEAGQPMHAFDLDKVRGSKIIVRRAAKGEKMTTIDGIERKLSEDMLIIADEQRPIAIAGVMGGLDTEVSASTKNILLESAYFDPISVRRTSRKLGLRSESSYRFERGVDLEAVVAASDRATVLIGEIAGGVAGPLTDTGRKKAKPINISFDVTGSGKLLGVDISSSKAKAIFKSLGLGATGSGNSLKVTIPSFRPDLKSQADLDEEVARIYGYEKIPTTIPRMANQARRKDFSGTIREKIREILIAGGLTEVVTHSLISRDSLKKCSPDETGAIEVVNPLSAEQEMMRPTLFPGMLNSILWNLNRRVEDLKLFELGNVYFKEKQEFSERSHLAVAMTGEVAENWCQKGREDFFRLKGIVEILLNRLGVTEVEFVYDRVPYLSAAETAVISIAGERVGFAGRLDSALLDRFDISQEVYAADLDMDAVLKHIKLKKQYEPMPKFPAITRDVSILLARAVPSSAVVSAIKETNVPSLVDIRVFDEYHGKQIPKDKKSLSLSMLYRDNSRTLTDQEAEQSHSKVKELLTTKFSAQLR